MVEEFYEGFVVKGLPPLSFTSFCINFLKFSRSSPDPTSAPGARSLLKRRYCATFFARPRRTAQHALQASVVEALAFLCGTALGLFRTSTTHLQDISQPWRYRVPALHLRLLFSNTILAFWPTMVIVHWPARTPKLRSNFVLAQIWSSNCGRRTYLESLAFPSLAFFVSCNW